MKINEIIKADLFRCAGTTSLTAFLHFLYSNPGFKFLFFFRLASQYSRKSLRGFIVYFWYKRYSIKYSFQIPISADLGCGIYLPHFGTIVVNSGSKIGQNCNLLQGVTIGNTKGGKNEGTPVIGNCVYIGPNAVIVGGVTIGDNVLIAPNTFVNFNVPENSIVIGNPGKIISRQNATENYINNIVKNQDIISQ